MDDREQDITIPPQLRGSELGRADWKPAPSPSRCSSAKIKSTVFGLFPILSWLPKYKIKDYIIPDLLGGLSGGTIQVPQGERVPSARPLPLSAPTLRDLPNPSLPAPQALTLSVLCRHGIRSAGQPTCSQWPLLLLLPPPDLLLPGGYTPDGAR